MKKKTTALFWLALTFALCASPALRAQDLLMVRSQQAFPEAMITLQNSIAQHGYTLSRVQRVDIGLTTFGFKTDKYRVVFFGKKDEIDALTEEHPEMIPYLPLQFAIFAEEQQTLVVATNPERFAGIFPASELNSVFQRWATDMRSILDDVRSAE